MYSSGHGTETLLNKLLSPLQVGIVYRISFSSLLFFLKTNNVVKSHLITLNSCKRTVTSPSSSSSRSVCVCVCVIVIWRSYGRLSLTSTGEFTGKMPFRRNLMKKKRMIIHIQKQVCAFKLSIGQFNTFSSTLYNVILLHRC